MFLERKTFTQYITQFASTPFDVSGLMRILVLSASVSAIGVSYAIAGPAGDGHTHEDHHKHENSGQHSTPTMSAPKCRHIEADFITPIQMSLLNDLPKLRRIAIESATRDTDAEAKQSIVALLNEPKPLPFDVAAGNYQCRKLQTDGINAFLYGFFKCSIKKGPEGTFDILKSGGSQRFSGSLERMNTNEDGAPNAGHLKYFGMYHNSDERPKPFDMSSDDAQVGCISQAQNGNLILEIPPQAGYRSYVIWEMKRK